ISVDFNGNWDDYLVENPVYFWNNLQNEVPELATFAAQIMSIPPTSAESERFWSFIANIYSPKCHQLTNEHAIKMTCIRCYAEIISNIKFNNMDNSNNNLEQFEEKE
ncbi:11723_t:CDS:2, partial [Dentiscutata heterogama]